MFPHFDKAPGMVQKHYLSALESIQLWACHSSFLDILSLMEYVVLFLFGTFG
jgi:hypothetical protein